MIYQKECPVCKSAQTELFLKSKDYFLTKKNFDIWTCRGCGLKFTNPRPESNELPDFYKSEEYISHSNTDKGIISSLYKFVRTYTLGTKERLLRRYVSRGTLLDYGCGTGHFLNHAKAKGWEVFGIEPDEGARTIAARTISTTFSSSAELSQNIPGQKFDAITLWHVMEHVPDLEKLNKFLSDHLAKKGILIIAVPNPESFDAKRYKSFWAAYDLPRHLWHFNQNSLEVLLKQAGFCLEATKPMRFDSYYVSLLSEKYQKGKASFFSAFVNGWLSNLKALSSKQYSSKIYIFRKG